MASTSLPELVSQLTSSLTATNAIGPTVAKVCHNPDGISLLDTKNELLLSYLQHLVFLILVKSRASRAAKKCGHPISLAAPAQAAIVNKLVELRLYLEKGVRPLEDKLRYQIDKVLRAAASADASDAALNGPKALPTTDALSDSGASDDEEGSGSDEEDSEIGSGVDEPNSLLAPHLGAFVRQTRSQQRDAKNKKGAAPEADEKPELYKASKTRRVLMPEDDKRPRTDRSRNHRSRTMDEYLQDEFSTAPSVLPSIGTNIRDRGRAIKTDVERKKEDERREWEETNYKRLPSESKKQKKQRAREVGRSNKMSFGGEEFRELGDGADRVSRMTKRKGGTGSRALLERSRKRGFESSGGRGVEMGERFQKRFKVLDGGRRER